VFEIRSAITLNGVALNIGRGIGPAIGGLIVAAIGPAAVFLLNSLSFAGIVIVLLPTKDNSSSKRTEETSRLLLNLIQGNVSGSYIDNDVSSGSGVTYRELTKREGDAYRDCLQR
jgi:Transmembrane secretion effector